MTKAKPKTPRHKHQTINITEGYVPPGAGEDHPRPMAGWDANLNLTLRNFLLRYRQTGKKSESARYVGIKSDPAAWSRARFLTKKVQDAWLMLMGKEQMHGTVGRPVIDAKMQVDHTLPPAQEVAEKAPADFKTMAGKRLLQEARKTPLDVMMQTMLDMYTLAEQEMGEDARGNPVDSPESLALKREACSVAKDAAPYMHARLSAVEAKVTNALEDLSDRQLDEKLAELSKRLDAASMATATPDAFNVPGILASSSGGEDDDEDGIPPVH